MPFFKSAGGAAEEAEDWLEPNLSVAVPPLPPPVVVVFVVVIILASMNAMCAWSSSILGVAEGITMLPAPPPLFLNQDEVEEEGILAPLWEPLCCCCCCCCCCCRWVLVLAEREEEEEEEAGGGSKPIERKSISMPTNLSARLPRIPSPLYPTLLLLLAGAAGAAAVAVAAAAVASPPPSLSPYRTTNGWGYPRASRTGSDAEGSERQAAAAPDAPVDTKSPE